MSEEEVNAGLRERAAERKRNALAKVQTLDLSQTTWPELPHPRVVDAITYVARRGLYRYPHLSGSELRGVLAERHGVPADRSDPRKRRRRAAELRHPRADRAGPAPADAVALLPAVSADGQARPRAPRARLRRHRRAAGGLPGGRREGDRAGEPQRPHRGAAGHRRAAPAAGGPAPGGGRAARRGARGLRRRPAARLLAGAAGGVPPAARVPQLLQGLGPGGPADRLRDRGPGRGGAAGRARPRPRRLGGLPGRRAGGDSAAPPS